ncbi:methyltransferase domain-containing protein [Paenibacillus sp. M1]|uniref:Methyltransferase domain-containing protein n=1 Tax=Paenibacillus haidiansis TaxID=1574488 RepID=A0ABU7VQM2_9BACL
MNNLDKNMAAASWLAAHEDLFRCPLCHAAMRIADGKSIICGNGHCFDIAKQGYINFLTRKPETKYDKALFASRKEIMDGGFFDPVDARIAEIIISSGPGRKAPSSLTLLDAGCGEGSHLAAVANRVRQTITVPVAGLGIDIAKEGVVLAAKRHHDLFFCVGNLADSPLADGRYDCILNILSPSNYAEFHRLLAEDGILIKAIPGPHYLQELRSVIFGEGQRRSYSNEKIERRFAERFYVEDSSRLEYKVRLPKPMLEHLITMTPLSWGARDEQLQAVLAREYLDVTIDMTVLAGRKRN